MNVRYQWSDDQTLLLLTLEEGWTWAEYHSVVRELSAAIRQLGHPVDAIVENTARIPFPSGSALSHLRQMMRVVPDNIGVIVVVSPNPLVKTINQILFTIAPKLRETVELADTRAEALAIIEKWRAQRHEGSEVD
jgi:hypothetical protein